MTCPVPAAGLDMKTLYLGLLGCTVEERTNRGPPAAAGPAACRSDCFPLRCGTSRSPEDVRVSGCVSVLSSLPNFPQSDFITTRITVNSQITEGKALWENVHGNVRNDALI